MTNEKQPKLPRGIHWICNSPYIWFSWRDASGKQHQRSTRTADPLGALLSKLVFLKEQKKNQEDARWLGPDLGKSPLGQVAEVYFDWKAANIAQGTLA